MNKVVLLGNYNNLKSVENLCIKAMQTHLET